MSEDCWICGAAPVDGRFGGEYLPCSCDLEFSAFQLARKAEMRALDALTDCVRAIGNLDAQSGPSERQWVAYAMPVLEKPPRAGFGPPPEFPTHGHWDWDYLFESCRQRAPFIEVSLECKAIGELMAALSIPQEQWVSWALPRIDGSTYWVMRGSLSKPPYDAALSRSVIRGGELEKYDGIVSQYLRTQMLAVWMNAMQDLLRSLSKREPSLEDRFLEYGDRLYDLGYGTFSFMGSLYSDDWDDDSLGSGIRCLRELSGDSSAHVIPVMYDTQLLWTAWANYRAEHGQTEREALLKRILAELESPEGARA